MYFPRNIAIALTTRFRLLSWFISFISKDGDQSVMLTALYNFYIKCISGYYSYCFDTEISPAFMV